MIQILRYYSGKLTFSIISNYSLLIEYRFITRQDSWFNYLFGVKESEAFGAINIATGKSTLFIPKLPEEYRIWCGEIHPPSHFQVSYAVDEAVYVDDMHTWLENTLREQGESARLHLMDGENTDSGLRCSPARFQNHEHFVANNLVDTSLLHHLLSTARVIKSAAEIEVMRYCAYVASNAHVEVMRNIRNCSFEYELEAKFLYEIYSKGGCRRCAYTSICACGPNSAVLHYGHAGAPNDRELKPTDIVSKFSTSTSTSINTY